MLSATLVLLKTRHHINVCLVVCDIAGTIKKSLWCAASVIALRKWLVTRLLLSLLNNLLNLLRSNNQHNLCVLDQQFSTMNKC